MKLSSLHPRHSVIYLFKTAHRWLLTAIFMSSQITEHIISWQRTSRIVSCKHTLEFLVQVLACHASYILASTYIRKKLRFHRKAKKGEWDIFMLNLRRLFFVDVCREEQAKLTVQKREEKLRMQKENAVLLRHPAPAGSGRDLSF